MHHEKLLLSFSSSTQTRQTLYCKLSSNLQKKLARLLLLNTIVSFNLRTLLFHLPTQALACTKLPKGIILQRFQLVLKHTNWLSQIISRSVQKTGKVFVKFNSHNILKAHLCFFISHTLQVLKEMLYNMYILQSCISF